MGIGDAGSIAPRERVGVAVDDHTQDAYQSALAELLDLLRDPGLAVRCRKAAQDHQGLENVVDNQWTLLRQVAVRGT